MSKSAVTYLKREYKKVLPVFVLAILYIGLIFLMVYSRISNINLEILLSFPYADEYGYVELGNVFIGNMGAIMGDLHTIFIIVLEFLLIQRVFYQENRAGVSDFLRTLPIQEKYKVAMKALAGESVIFGFCAMFGIVGSLTNAALDARITEAASFFRGAGPTENTYVIIWQIALLMFLALSTIFLVLFVARLCIHNQVLATIVGAGFLFVPTYYSYIYQTVTGTAKPVISMAAGLINHIPITYSMQTASSDGGGIDLYHAEWRCYPEKVTFLLILVAIALACLIVCLYRRWNVRESNNTLINSPGVAEFIACGLSISVGLGWNLITGAYSFGMTGRQISVFFVQGFIYGAIVWAVIHGIGFGIMKRRKGA